MGRLLVIVYAFCFLFACGDSTLSDRTTSNQSEASISLFEVEVINDVALKINWQLDGEASDIKLVYSELSISGPTDLNCSAPTDIDIEKSQNSLSLNTLSPSTSYKFKLCLNKGSVSQETQATTKEYCHGTRLTNSPFANSHETNIDGSSSENSFTICTAAQLNNIGSDISNFDKHFKLMTDIDLSAYSGTSFNLIGSSTNPFVGVFDGNNHILDGFTYDDVDLASAGMFKEIDGVAELKNIIIKNADINLNSNTGVLVGVMNAGTINNIKIQSGTMKGRWACHGGLVGLMLAGTISKVYLRMDVIFIDGLTGGVVGCMYDASIDQASFVGNITGVQGFSDRIGGIAGDVGGTSTITNAYARGNMTGSGHGWGVGGLVGVATSDVSIQNAFAQMDIDVTNYNGGTGPVDRSIGELNGATHSSNYSDSSSNCTTCNQTNSTALTTGPNFQQSDFTGFDFENIWVFDQNSKLPVLSFE